VLDRKKNEPAATYFGISALPARKTLGFVQPGRIFLGVLSQAIMVISRKPKERGPPARADKPI
jgi:hypothetical protein